MNNFNDFMEQFNNQYNNLGGFMLRSFEPWYDDRADYNTNAKSYYDYLARFNKYLHVLTVTINDVIDKDKEQDNKLTKLESNDITVSNTNSLDLIKSGDWSVNKDINILGNVKISNKKGNNLKIYDDGLFSYNTESNIDVNKIDYKIGINGDFKNLKECFEYIDNNSVFNKKINVILLKDYVLNEQLFIFNKDYRHVNITSENTEVLADLIQNPEIITEKGDTDIKYIPYFYGNETLFPTIKTSFKAIYKDNNLYTCFGMDNSTLTIYPNNKILNFAYMGIYGTNGSIITCDLCEISDTGNRDKQLENVADQDYYGDGIRINNSTLNGKSMKINRNGSVGLNISHGSNANVDKTTGEYNGHHALMSTTSSNVSAQSASFTHTTDDCVVAYAGSSIDFRNGNSSFSHTAYGLIATRGGIINFDGGVSNGCYEAGIMANRGSIIDATNATVKDSKKLGIIASNSSKIEFSYGTIENSGGDGIQSTHGGLVNARGSKIINSGRYGILAYCGEIHAMESSIKTTKDHGVNATRGGYINVCYSEISETGGEGILAYGANVNAFNSKIKKSSNNGILSTRGGFVNISEGEVSDCEKNGIQAYGGVIKGNEIKIHDILLNPVIALNGGEITIYGCNIDGTRNASGNHYDINAEKTGTIKIDKDNKNRLSIKENELLSGSLIMKG